MLMLRPATMPVPCCDNCLPERRGDWEVRANPYLLYGGGGPDCAFCGASDPGAILTDACPFGLSPPA